MRHTFQEFSSASIERLRYVHVLNVMKSHHIYTKKAASTEKPATTTKSISYADKADRFTASDNVIRIDRHLILISTGEERNDEGIKTSCACFWLLLSCLLSTTSTTTTQSEMTFPLVRERIAISLLQINSINSGWFFGRCARVFSLSANKHDYISCFSYVSIAAKAYEDVQLKYNIQSIHQKLSVIVDVNCENMFC